MGLGCFSSFVRYLSVFCFFEDLRYARIAAIGAVYGPSHPPSGINQSNSNLVPRVFGCLPLYLLGETGWSTVVLSGTRQIPNRNFHGDALVPSGIFVYHSRNPVFPRKFPFEETKSIFPFTLASPEISGFFGKQ